MSEHNAVAISSYDMVVRSLRGILTVGVTTEAVEGLAANLERAIETLRPYAGNEALSATPRHGADVTRHVGWVVEIWHGPELERRIPRQGWWTHREIAEQEAAAWREDGYTAGVHRVYIGVADLPTCSPSELASAAERFVAREGYHGGPHAECARLVSDIIAPARSIS